MRYRRHLDTTDYLQVVEHWRNEVRIFEVWWMFQPDRVGYGVTLEEAIRNMPVLKAAAKDEG